MEKHMIGLMMVFFCSCSTQPISNDYVGGSTAVAAGSALYNTIADLDARLFEQGFNNCDLPSLNAVTANDFEFYHDQAGTNGSRNSFVASIETYVCKNDYRAQRRMLPETMEVFPLYRNNSLYGAIQTASHEFYAVYPDGHRQLTDTARLFTLWIKTSKGWKMRRSFSYDHNSYD